MKQEYINAIFISDSLISLLNTEGWKIVNDLFERKRQEFITCLIQEKDINKIYYYQAGIQVIDDILGEVEGLIKTGMEVKNGQRQSQ
ncbi:MAG TPA: hypothetical protein PKN66_09180 [Thermodesulfovibrio thiophilus]|nr:hypothetical protein [Thermodesulfovibrio thiophilus]